MQPGAIHACLLTPDPLLVAIFTDVCHELDIEVCAIRGEGLAEELARARYDAVLIDFDLMPDAMAMLGMVRQSSTTRNAVIMAVTTKAADKEQALVKGATVLFNRPLDAKEVRRLLHGSYENMVRERRRYFRCSAEMPGLLIRVASGEDLRCITMNVSSSGVGLKAPLPLVPGEEIQIVLLLQNTDVMIRVVGVVIWDDKHGKTGISFKCTGSQHQIDLETWLDARFDLSDCVDVKIKKASV